MRAARSSARCSFDAARSSVARPRGAAQHHDQRDHRQRQREVEHRVAQRRGGGVPSGIEHEIGHVHGVVGQEEQAFPPRDAVARVEDGEAGRGGGHHHHKIERQQSAWHLKPGADNGRGAKNEGQVEDVAAEDVAHRDVTMAACGGDQRRRHLGERGAHRHDGEADDIVAHAQHRGERRRAVDQRSRPQHQDAQAGQHQHPGRHPVEPRRPLGLVGRLFGLAACRAQQPPRVDPERCDQHHPVDNAQLAVERQPEREQRDGHHQRHLDPHDAARHKERRHQGGEPEDAERVEDVAAERVAQGEVAGAGTHRLHRDGQLGGARAEGDDREPDHQRRDTVGQRHPHRAADQQLAPEDE
jgi:hypothetical protein